MREVGYAQLAATGTNARVIAARQGAFSTSCATACEVFSSLTLTGSKRLRYVVRSSEGTWNEIASRLQAGQGPAGHTVRLHSAIGYLAPADFLAGCGPAIWAERDRRLEVARELRSVRRADRYHEATVGGQRRLGEAEAGAIVVLIGDVVPEKAKRWRSFDGDDVG